MKSPTSYLLSAICIAALPAFSAFATSEPEPIEDCRSDADCAEGFYCEVPGATCAVVCDDDMNCDSLCDELMEEPSGYCIEEYVIEATECFEDSDCAPGDVCQYVVFAADEEMEQPTPAAPGICGPVWEEEGCESDADCGEGAHCETWFVSNCLERISDGESDVSGDDCNDEFYQGICVDDDIYSGHCQSNADCGPDQYCNADYGWCESRTDILVEPEVPESCVTDEECGPGGFCVQEAYDCPPGVMCMMPAQPVGYCEYYDGFVDEPECIVAVYDECVVYADGDQELSCEATSGAPTWLAFLAVLGLARRRKVQR